MSNQDEKLDQTVRDSERIISEFEKLEQEYKEKREAENSLARELGARDFDHLIEAGMKSLSDEEKAKVEQDAAEFQDELEKELLQIREQAGAASQRAASGAGRMSRFGRTV